MPRSDDPETRSTYVSAKEAIAMLGIKPETLYAYVSRGLLRSVPGGSARERLYAREDVETLVARRRARGGKGGAATTALRWGDPVLESAITLITPDELCYRGIPVGRLPATFECVAELLWTGVLPPPLAWERPRLPAASLDALARFPRGVATAARYFLHVINVAGLSGDEARDPRLDAVLGRARGLIRLLAAAAGGKPLDRALQADSVAGSFLLGYGARPDAARTRAVNRALIAFADHELNASTFAARVAASTGADLYACLSAAMAALSGPKHGAAVDAVSRFLDGIEKPHRARAVVQAALASRVAIPGFGHRLYPQGDPRAKELLALSRELAPSDPVLARIDALIEAAALNRCGAPTGDVALVALASVLGLPPEAAFTLFAVGRAAGWVAHVLEQRQADTLVRPRARYVGRPRQAE